MDSRILTAILVVAVVLSAVILMPRLTAYHLPGNQQGYEPQQPIAFSHRLHAGEMKIHCLYCHFGAERSRHAGIPGASVCMNCHRFVTAPLDVIRAEDVRAKKEHRAPRHIVAKEIAKIYDALGLDQKGQPDPRQKPRPIVWTQVDTLPDFAYFDHRPHVWAGVACQTCHGPVEQMERVRQVEALTMGWCVNCHRKVNTSGVNGRKVDASTDCVTCHY